MKTWNLSKIQDHTANGGKSEMVFMRGTQTAVAALLGVTQVTIARRETGALITPGWR
jgi:hypothetical protein